MKLSEIMTTKQVAEFLHCSTHQVGYLRKYGLLVGTRFGKYWLFEKEEIIDFVRRSKGKDYANFRDMTPEAARKKYGIEE